MHRVKRTPDFEEFDNEYLGINVKLQHLNTNNSTGHTANITVNDRLDIPYTSIDPKITDVKKVRYANNGTSTIHHTVVRFGAVGG